MTDTTHKSLPGDGKAGLCCLSCQSVIFGVGKLIRHVHERPGHRYFKSGDDLVIHFDYLRDVDPGAVSHYNYLKDEAEAD